MRKPKKSKEVSKVEIGTCVSGLDGIIDRLGVSILAGCSIDQIEVGIRTGDLGYYLLNEAIDKLELVERLLKRARKEAKKVEVNGKHAKPVVRKSTK